MCLEEPPAVQGEGGIKSEENRSNLEQIVEHPSRRVHMSCVVILDKKSCFCCKQLLPDHFAPALTVSGNLPSVWKSDSGDTKPIRSAGDLRIFSLEHLI